MNEQSIRSIIREVLAGDTIGCGAAALNSQPLNDSPKGRAIPLEVSARHVHLTRQAVEQLFRAGAVLGRKRDLSQPGEFLSDRRVRLISPQGVMENVAVLGPERGAIQVELSASDCRTLGIRASVNLSGDLSGAGDITIAGDHGCVFAASSVITARAHLHMSPKDAFAFGVQDGEHVGIQILSARPLTLGDVVVRVRDNFALACHIDVDEANAALADGASKAVLANGKAQSVPAGAINPAADCPYLDGVLVTEAMAVSVRSPGGRVRIRKGTIVTPAAKDVFSGMRMIVEIV